MKPLRRRTADEEHELQTDLLQRQKDAYAEQAGFKNRIPPNCFRCPHYRADRKDCSVNERLVKDCAIYRIQIVGNK